MCKVEVRFHDSSLIIAKMTSKMDSKFVEISSVQNGLDSDMDEMESMVIGFENNISK